MVKGPLAGASGPGKFSKRTDMELGSQFYGDDISQINTAAIKSKTRGVADNVGGRPADYEGLSSDGTHQFMVGDTVIVSTTGGDRGSPFVKGYCPYGG